MPTLEIANLLPLARLSVGPGQALLKAIQAAGFDWAWACGGKGRCTSCRLRLTAGAEWLSGLTPAEERFRALGRLPLTDRLCCQATLLPNAPADAVLCGTVPREGRLPHLIYRSDGAIEGMSD